MKNLYELDAYRVTDPQKLRHVRGWPGDETCGKFEVKSCIDRAVITVVASSGYGWDHVSVSRLNRSPNWMEMEQIAALFFKKDESAVQYHVPAADHVNNHPYCLHWWRPLDASLPRPPAIFVGYKDLGVLDEKGLAEVERRLADLPAVTPEGT